MIFAVAETLTSFFLLILLQDEMVPLNLWNNTQKPVNGFIDYYNRVLFKEQWRGTWPQSVLQEGGATLWIIGWLRRPDTFYRHIVLTYFIAHNRPREMLSANLFLSVDLGFLSESIWGRGAEDKSQNPCQSMALSDAKKFRIMQG